MIISMHAVKESGVCVCVCVCVCVGYGGRKGGSLLAWLWREGETMDGWMSGCQGCGRGRGQACKHTNLRSLRRTNPNDTLGGCFPRLSRTDGQHERLDQHPRSALDIAVELPVDREW